MSTGPEPIEVQAEKVEPSLAVGPHQPENAVKGQTTPAQAKVEAIASLTMSAYQKASQLVLTIEEIEKLQAEFPDEAFKPGAGGKDNLIYIEHAFLRDRMNQVFGPGQWAIVPRNRWAENYKTSAGKDAVRVYVEAMLCIRGCFAAEAIGDMDYFPHNSATNYGDAVEGAKSAALRRCVKELGVGLQAWKKDWCEGWWQRKRAGKRQPLQEPSEPPAAAPKAKPAPKQATPAKTADVLPKAATEATRKWFLTEMEKSGVDFGELHDWAVQQSFLIPNEALDDWPLHKVPTSRQEFGQLLKQFEQWQKGNAPQAKEDEPWRSVPIPGWSKHVKEEGFKTFGDLPKEKLWWWCVKWQPVCDEHGKVSTKDFDLRQMLDEVNEKYSFSNPVDDDVVY